MYEHHRGPLTLHWMVSVLSSAMTALFQIMPLEPPPGRTAGSGKTPPNRPIRRCPGCPPRFEKQGS